MKTLAITTCCSLMISGLSSASLVIPSDGSDGAFNPPGSIEVDLSQAVDGTWSDPSPSPGLGIYDGTAWTNTGVTTANDGQWHHLAFVLDNDGSESFASIYLDGVAVDMDPAMDGLQTTRDLAGNSIVNLAQQATNYRQRFASNYSGAADRLSGFYDDLMIFDTALSAEDIRVLTEVPEPATIALVGLAAAGLGGYVRRRRTA